MCSVMSYALHFSDGWSGGRPLLPRWNRNRLLDSAEHVDGFEQNGNVQQRPALDLYGEEAEQCGDEGIRTRYVPPFNTPSTSCWV